MSISATCRTVVLKRTQDLYLIEVLLQPAVGKFATVSKGFAEIHEGWCLETIWDDWRVDFTRTEAESDVPYARANKLLRDL